MDFSQPPPPPPPPSPSSPLQPPHRNCRGEGRVRCTSLKITRESYLLVRDLSAKNGSTQAEYVERMLKVLNVVAGRSGVDPVSVFESLVGVPSSLPSIPPDQ